ncbi:unnamed protein product [Nesidiocoris tenuis]|uniref:Polycystin domain-containing protein n=1 Tax=Nesidiocoris tenuis TaxID=355587 RepID=A0A6H5G8G9_9HEMI|nr:unnamed protein product [Nesidiocoris tenuis]
MDSGNDNRDEVKNWHDIDSSSGTPGLEGLRKSGIRRRRLQHDSDVYFEAGEGDGQLVPLQRVSNFVIDAAKKSEGKTTRKGRNPWNRGVSPELDNELENNPTTTKGNAENSEPKADKKHGRKKRPPRSAEFKYYSVLWDVIERYTDTEPSTNIIFQIKDFILNFLFFIATTVLLYGSSNQLGNYYSNIATKVMIESKCEIPKSAPVNFLNIRRDAELWSFVDQVLLKVLYENTTLGRVLSENVLLGRPRIRQIRVKGDTCNTANLFEPFFKSCYDYYDYAVEDKEPFGLKSSHWKYQDGKDREQTQGRISTYDSGGYMYELDNNLNDTKKNSRRARKERLELCSEAIYACLNLCSTKRLSGKLARRRLEKIRRKDREALAPILRRYECRGLHLALILKKYERGSTELEKSYDDDKIYSEIQLRNQLIMEVEEHEKISQQLEKVAKSLDFMDQNLSDITSKVDYLVNKVINKKRVV